jgi:hypothetical protein
VEGGCICRGVYRRRPFLRGVLDGAGVVGVVVVFFTVLAVEGGVFGVDAARWWVVSGDEAGIIGNPVGRDGDVGTVSVPFLEEDEVAGRESSRMFSGREEDFGRERVLLLIRLMGVDIPSVQRQLQRQYSTRKGERRGLLLLVLACERRKGGGMA